MGGKRLLVINEGQKFNYLTFINETFSIDNSTGHKVRVAECLCDCGKIIETKIVYLLNGRRKSCGCKNMVSVPPLIMKHGMTYTRIYMIWNAMKKRCRATKGYNFKYYGSRGIKVCDEWENSFMAFYNWSMANGYTDELTLDREDNDMGYSPQNCRWATKIMQANNTRSNVFFEYNGERKTISEWARVINMNKHTLYKRVVRNGWSIEYSLTMPLSVSQSRVKK